MKNKLYFIRLLFYTCLLFLRFCCVGQEKQLNTNAPKMGYYLTGANGRQIKNTDVDRFWTGTWVENTNGWRVQLDFWNTNIPSQFAVEVGSIKVNSGGGYVQSPIAGFSKFQMVDSNGIAVSAKEGATLEVKFPSKLSVNKFHHWPDGEIYGDFGFVSNGPPEDLGKCDINDIFTIKNDGYYLITVCPVLYQYGTNNGFLDRIDLPCVTAKIYLTSKKLKM